MSEDFPLGMPPSVPDHELLRAIGTEGAYGEVWLARSVMGVYRAVKIVHRDRFDSDGPYNTEFEGLRQFHDISREHVGFVDILHVSRNEHERYFTYVMELADDLADQAGRQQIDPQTYVPRTLASVLSRRRRLSVPECVELAVDLTAALSDLHKRSLVHRDIKPSNIILIKGHAKIGDIGLVAEVTDQPLPKVGTPPYMDEELHGTARGDLFSFGRVLYVMATGRKPEEWPNWPAELGKDEDISGLRELNEIYLKACHTDRLKRYQSADEIHRDLLLLKAAKSVRRLVELERLATAARRYGVLTLLLLLLGGVVWRQRVQQANQRDELLQRTVGSYVAYGTRAMDDNDLPGALPWFAEALRLDQDSPVRQSAHRLRMASVLSQAPEISQMWFRSPPLAYAEYGTNRFQVLASDARHRWNLFDLASGRPLGAFFGQDDQMARAHLSPRGDLAVTTSLRFPPEIWNVTSGERLWQYSDTNRNNLFNAAFSPDGATVAIGGNHGDVMLWNMKTGEHSNLGRHPSSYVTHLAFSHAGNQLATCGLNGSVHVWDLATRQSRPLPGHSKRIYHATFSPDDQVLATASLDWTVRLCNVTSGQEVCAPLPHGDAVRGVEFSSDGRRLVTAGWDFAARVWDAKTGILKLSLPHNSKVMHAAFNDQGRQVMTVCYDGTIRFWELNQDSTLPPPQLAQGSSDGQQLIRFKLDRVEFENPAGAQFGTALLLTNRTPANTLFSRDASIVVTMDVTNANNLTIRAMSRAPGPARERLQQYTTGLTNLVLTADGRHLAAYLTNRVVVVDLKRGREIASVVLSNGLTIADAAISPGGDHLALAAKKHFEIWEITPERTRRITTADHTMLLSHVEFSPDGRWCVSAGRDGSLDPARAFVWDTQTGRAVGDPLSHRDGIYVATFSPDSQRVITCSEDDTAIIWETQTGRQLTPPLRHKQHVVDAAFSADGRWVATACMDGTVRVWEVETGEPLTPPYHHPDPVARVQFAGPRRLVTRTEAEKTHVEQIRVIDLPNEGRPVRQLVLLAQLLSAQQSHRSGALLPQTSDALREIWEELHPRGTPAPGAIRNP